MKEGDRNTKFFLKMASASKMMDSMARAFFFFFFFLSVARDKINGPWQIKKIEIREGVVGAFHNLLSTLNE